LKRGKPQRSPKNHSMFCPKKKHHQSAVKQRLKFLCGGISPQSPGRKREKKKTLKGKRGTAEPTEKKKACKKKKGEGK